MTHDLDAILLEVSTHFAKLPQIRIDWVDLDEVGPSLFLEHDDYACCTYKNGAYFIGIHPAMKKAPKYVVRYTVFHEVLHVALPPRGRQAHHKAFLVAERLWPDFVRADAWFDDPKNYDRLWGVSATAVPSAQRSQQRCRACEGNSSRSRAARQPQRS